MANWSSTLWKSTVAARAASHFVRKWFNQHPEYLEEWKIFKPAFLEKIAIKDSDVMIMTELGTFKMTGTIKEYIAAYEDMHDQAPDTINFDEAGPLLDFYNSLLTHQTSV
ncbi:hypothetical protein DSO57_1038218 [Entomophthora muscae]|uniref:Uncharacterized protein n=1 Tax=Entomophthora muscae TaxID=34485 RepID=A0ACC2TLU0_9FUNG|nr:hypothetical protein DSO57_1038218 [Entomophthora muscae]